MKPFTLIIIMTILFCSACSGSQNPAGIQKSSLLTQLPETTAAADDQQKKTEKKTRKINHCYFKNLPSVPYPDRIETRLLNHGSVVLIVIDALNASHTSVYGYHHNTTPVLNRFAAGGVTFTSWISNSSWTRPSFTTILTGLPKNRHKMELGSRILDNKIVTMAEAFKKAGYQTAAFIGNPLITKKWNYNQGFDLFIDSDTSGPFPRGALLVDMAINWLNSVKDRPFFLTLFLTDPHAPYQPEQSRLKFLNPQNITLVPLPDREVEKPLSLKETLIIQNAYDDEVLSVDTEIGRLLKALVPLNQSDNLTTAVTADHGEIFGAHNCYQHAYHMWEPVVRVPFIIQSPAIIEHKGIYVDMPATHQDIMPTLLKLNSIAPPANMPGRNIFSKTDSSARIIITAYDARGIKRTAARLGTVKLVRYGKVNHAMFSPVGKSSIQRFPSLLLPAPRYELYDLKNDPDEKNNIFKTFKNRKLIKQLQSAIVNSENKNRKKKKSEHLKLDDETLEALKAAGYIK